MIAPGDGLLSPGPYGEHHDERATLTREFLDAQRALGEQLLARRLKPLFRTRLTVQQLRALGVLTLDGESSAHRLADVLGVSAATLTGIVDRLETAGMVTRRSDPLDGRVRLVAPTDRGSDAIREIVAQDDGDANDLLDQIDLDDLRGLAYGVGALLAAARRMGED